MIHAQAKTQEKSGSPQQTTHESIHPSDVLPNLAFQTHRLQKPDSLLGELHRSPLLHHLELPPLEAHPTVQLGALLVFFRYPRRAVPGVERDKLGVPVVPKVLALHPRPLEPDGVEEVDSRAGHVVGTALVEEPVLLLLGADPGVELLARHGDVEVAVLLLVALQLLLWQIR